MSFFLLSAGLETVADFEEVLVVAEEFTGLVLEQLAIKIIIDATKKFLIMGLI